MDICTSLTAIAVVKHIAGVATGMESNAGWAAVTAVYGKVDEWRRGQGQPVNHHLQRALRISLLGATKHLVEPPNTFLDADQRPWFDRALKWISAEQAKLKDEAWEPPEPPGGWQPSLILEATIEQAEGDVRSLRNTLARMLTAEWAEAGLTPAPASILKALYEDWDWFNKIGLYFADQLKTHPEVNSIFAAGTLARLDIKTDLILVGVLAGRPTAANETAFNAPSKPSYFIGRESILETLRTELAEPGAVVPLVGMPGLGKTSLAIAFAHAHRAVFDGVYWIDCSGVSLESAATELATQLKIEPKGDPAAQLREIRRQCAALHNLLVLDNVESNDFRDLIAQGHCSVLLTTRYRNLPFLSRYRAPDLRLFTPEESLDVFREYLGSEAVEKHEKEYREIAAALDGLPLGVAIAAGLLSNDSRYTLGRLLLFLKEQSLHKLSDGELDINRLLSAAISSAPESSRALLAAMAVCAPSGFRQCLAAEIAQLDETTALEALHDIHSRSLVEEIDKESRRYRLHSLIRSVAGRYPALEQRHAEAIARRFKLWKDNWRECEEDLADWRIALSWSNERNTTSSDVLRPLAEHGWMFGYRRGFLADALWAMEVAASAFEESGDRANLGASYGNKSLILRAWGRLEEAMELFKKQEKIFEELGDRAGLSLSYGNQAATLQAWGRLEEAMVLLKRQEEICEESGDRAGLGASYGNQALILRNWGKLEESMVLLRQQEKICNELGDRAGLQTSCGNQALILKAWRQPEEAMDLLKRQEKICEELGDRAGLARSYGNQANILSDWGRFDEAMDLHKRQEKICEELGDRAGLQRSYGNQALIPMNRGRLEEAMELLKRQKKICEDLEDRESLQINHNNQALILKAWGRLEEAMELAERQLAICHNIGLRDGLRSGFLLQADLFEAMGQPEKAPPLRAEAAAIEAELMHGRGATA